MIHTLIAEDSKLQLLEMLTVAKPFLGLLIIHPVDTYMHNKVARVIISEDLE